MKAPDTLWLAGARPTGGNVRARAREQVRQLAGLDHPISCRSLDRALDLAGLLFHAPDAVELLDERRQQVDEVLIACLAVDALRAERQGQTPAAARLREIGAMARLVLPRGKRVAQVLDVGTYKGGLISALRRTRGRDLDYLAVDIHSTCAPEWLSVTPMDATRLTLPANSVDQVFLLDVIEHLRSPEQLRQAVSEAVRVARDLVYIECPDFGDVDYLAHRRLKWCWSDWTDHTLPVTRALLNRVVDDLCLDDVARVRSGESVYDSSHYQLVRLDAPRDTTIAVPDFERWRPEGVERFDRVLHHRVILEVRKRPGVRPLWQSPTRPSHLHPCAQRDVPTEDWQMGVLCATLTERGRPYDEAEVAAEANLAVHRILAGSPDDVPADETGARPELVATMLGLFARVVEAGDQPTLAADLRACSEAWSAEGAGR